MVSKEMRSYMRENFSFEVRFRKISPQQYESLKGNRKQNFYPAKKKLIIDGTDADNRDKNIILNSDLIDFLLHIDEKLDHIVAMLSNDEIDDKVFNKGRGVNISGSGMSLIIDKLVETGQIIQTNFVLSKFPLVFIDVFGEVLRVTPVEKEGKTSYEVGIRFLDLKDDERERIIAYVFQRQREAIRGKKNGKQDKGAGG